MAKRDLRLPQNYVDHWQGQRRPAVDATPETPVPVVARRAVNAHVDATTYEVIVGNVGTVYSGPDRKKAYGTYLSYVADSINGYGRVAHEPVTLMAGDEIMREHTPVGRKDDDEDTE